MAKKSVLIINPASGKESPDVRRLAKLLAEHGDRGAIYVSTGELSFQQLVATALKEEPDQLLIWGGDGTINQVVKPVMEHELPLGVLPGGSANILARELAIPLDPYQACENYLSSSRSIQKVDVGICGEKVFIMRAEVGLHADVIMNSDRELKEKIGWGAYWLTGISHYTNPEIFAATLEIDGKPFKYDDLVILFVSNANTLNFAGKPLEDPAEVSSGKLYLVIVRASDVESIPKMLTALKEAITETETLECHSIESLKVITDTPQSIIVDGETGGDTPVDIRVKPAAFSLLI